MISNKKYWQNRSEKRMANYHKNSDETIFKVNKAYDKAINDINSDIRNIVSIYKLKGDLSNRELKRLLNTKIPNPIRKIMGRVLPNVKNEKIRKYLLSRYNAEAYKARITRLEALKDSINISIKKVADIELEATTKLYTNNIKEAYYRTLFDTQKGVNIGFNVASMSQEQIQEILKNNWSGEHYSERIWNNSNVFAGKLADTLLAGMMAGHSIQKIAKKLDEYTSYGKFVSERLARTETTYVCNAAEMESYKECDIEKYVFVATLDSRTSELCREHDGDIYEVRKAMAGFNMPPLHAYCRSTTIAYMGEEWLKGIKRRARDPVTGKTDVVNNMSYDEWYKNHVIATYGQNKVQSVENAVKNRSADKTQFEKYREVLGKESPKVLKEFQELKYNNVKEWNELKDKFEPAFLKKDFKDIPSFHQNSSALLTRKWYKSHDENISNLIDKAKPIEQQARQAHSLRNHYRTQARDLMKDQEKRKELDIKFPNITFEQLLEHKKLKYGLSNEEAYKDILRSSQTTNKKYDKIAGIKEE